MPVNHYTTIADVRAQGAPFDDTSTYSDDFVTARIAQASEAIERFTGIWFGPKDRTIAVDGVRAGVLRPRVPIVKIDSVTITYRVRYGADPSYSIDPSELAIYNRHLTMGLTSPDDRRAPKVAILGSADYPRERLDVFPAGEQNVHLEGTFGWTELAYDDDVGETSPGSQVPLSLGGIPPLVGRCCLMLVRRYWPTIGDFQGQLSVQQPIGNVTELVTRDQKVKFASGSAASGTGQISSGFAGSTGDPEIDNHLLVYQRGPNMSWE